jgi:hypothetical protein
MVKKNSEGIPPYISSSFGDFIDERRAALIS